LLERLNGKSQVQGIGEFGKIKHSSIIFASNPYGKIRATKNRGFALFLWANLLLSLDFVHVCDLSAFQSLSEIDTQIPTI